MLVVTGEAREVLESPAVGDLGDCRAVAPFSSGEDVVSGVNESDLQLILEGAKFEVVAESLLEAADAHPHQLRDCGGGQRFCRASLDEVHRPPHPLETAQGGGWSRAPRRSYVP